MAHADMVLNDHIRADGSVNHIVEHDLNTGKFIKSHVGQGYSEHSCWSRGLAWAVYGMTLFYLYTNEARYLDAAVKTANYFIINCRKFDYKTVVDFKAPEKPVYYDSTAGVIAECGFIELSKYVSAKDSDTYIDAAIKLLQAADEHFCNYDENVDSILYMGTERYPISKDIQGVHIPIIYGDFFFVESLCKLKNIDFLMW